MAKSGRRPPADLRNTLGSLVQSALEQVGVVREVVERSAQAQRSRYDTIKLERRRRDALASLGEVVYRLAVRGRLGALGDDPEVRAQLEQIDDVDQRLESAGAQGESGFAANSGWPRGERARGRGRRSGEGEVRVWRPVPPFAAPEAHPDDELDDEVTPTERPTAAPARPQPLTGSGGIRFGDDWDDDEDLEQYMHDDDVPEAAATAEPEPEPEPEKPKPKPKPRKRRAPKSKKK